MQFVYFINLIFIFAVNVLFFCSGICLNSLVIVSFWRSSLLRKKLCYFMIMILSCCDLFVVLTFHPMVAVIAMLHLTENVNATYCPWTINCSRAMNIFFAFSLLALLVMNFDRYLATYYPLFHRTSVTKGKLLGLLGILSILGVPFLMLTANDIIFSYKVGLLICFGILFPPMLFFNYKLFIIARKNRRNNATSPEIKKTFSMKNVSNCLLAVGCFVVLSIPVFVYSGLKLTLKDTLTLESENIVALWSRSISSMNSTFNCLIFYWQNKTLRDQGKKVLKILKFSS